MSKFWSAVVHSLTPYVPGEQPKIDQLIKLNTNENPYPPSPLVLEAIQHETDDSLRFYPDPHSESIKNTIAQEFSLSSAEVFVGNGSDEVLAHIFYALLKHDAPLLFPDVSYSFYPVYCQLYNINYQTIALDAQFRIDLAEYKVTNGGIIFPNPNAPTGIALPLEPIESLLQRNTESVVVIDEAYVDFGAQSASGLIKTYPNLLVVQTLSKARSLAGLRLGYAMGNADLINALVRVKDSFNSYPIDRLASAGAIAAFADRAYFEHTRAKVMATRQTLTLTMSQLGFVVLPSAANFIFAHHPQFSGADLAVKLRARGIVVRHFTKPERITDFLRISIGTEAQNQALIAALTELIGEVRRETP